MLGFSTLWVALAVGGTALRQHRLGRAMADGRAAVVEGTVHDFTPMSAGCRRPESFRVQDQRFAYRDCEDTGGFNRSSTLGGPLHGGERVRITYAGAKIPRLEILKP